MTKKSFLAEKRIILSRLIVVCLILIIIFLTPTVRKTPILSESLEFIGMIFAITGVLGRVFSSIFMSNNRDQKVVSTGIYSVTRNPLYLFSFISTLGIALIYGSIIVIAVYIVIFFACYNKVIKGEETYLTNKFGEIYTHYKNSTPRFFPNFKLWRIEEEYVTTSYRCVLKTTIDSSIILLVALLLIYYIRFNPFSGSFYIY